MYHTILPPHMIMQIVNGQQVNGPCPTVQNTHATVNGGNNSRQGECTTPYLLDGSGQNRHRLIQTSSYPLELYQMMRLDIPPIHRAGFGPSLNSSSGGFWQNRRGQNGGNNLLTMPPPHLNNYNRQNNTGSVKKPNWNNRSNKRNNSYKDQSQKSTTQSEPNQYNSDSGFSSRSPTPSKNPGDSSHAESSDDRDSVSSGNDQDLKKLPELPLNAIQNISLPLGFIPSVSPHQYYQEQRRFDYYQNISPTARSTQLHENYQGKKRYTGRVTPPSQQKNLRGRNKYTGTMIPSYNFFPRTSFAPDRFLARSHLVQVTKPPPDLIRLSRWDDLSRDIWKKFIVNQQTENTFRNKMMLWKYLYIYIKSTYPKYSLFLVGSTMNGFGSDSSDVDMCLLVRSAEIIQRAEAIWHLDQIMMCLNNCDFITNSELIQAKVPILKFRDGMQNLDVDLNCNNAVGVRNTHLLYCYSQIDWRVRPLVLVVKLWAQSQDINDAKNMTISSYSLVLMVIHFLQCGVTPSVLPCLHSSYGQKFNPHTDIHSIDIHEDLHLPAKPASSVNHQPLGELLYEFFRYYTNFDYNNHAVSVRTARTLSIEECRHTRSWKNDPHQWKYLCIEEPFDLTNTARSVYDYDVFIRIKTVFCRAYQKLKETRNLASIFVKLVPDSRMTYPKP